MASERMNCSLIHITRDCIAGDRSGRLREALRVAELDATGRDIVSEPMPFQFDALGV